MNNKKFLCLFFFMIILKVSHLQAQLQLDVDGNGLITGELEINGTNVPNSGSILEIIAGATDDKPLIYFNENPNDPLFFFKSGFTPTGNDNFLKFGSRFNDNIMIWKANGKTGIGTSNPSHQLTIFSTDTETLRLFSIGGSGSGARINFGDLDQVYIDEPTNDMMEIHAANGIKLLDNTTFNQKVGIGIPTSIAQLHLKMNSDDSTAGIRFEQNTNTNYWNIRASGNDLLFEYNDVQKGYIDDETMGFVSGSDRRLKKNISSFPDVLEDVLRLRPATYDYRSVENPQRKVWGFIAQEVEEIFPEMVYQNGEFRGLAYAEFAVLSIKAIQELNTKIEKEKTAKQELLALNETLAAKVNQLEHQLANLPNLDALIEKANALEAKLNALAQLDATNNPPENSTNLTLSETAYVAQNTPNPFNGETVIKYYLPEWTKAAQIQFMDVHGNVLKVEHNLQIGHGSIQLDAKAMPNGTYTYSLVIDGQLVETKQMILVK